MIVIVFGFVTLPLTWKLLRNRKLLVVAAIHVASSRYTQNVNATALSVPTGMLCDGRRSSPLIFAPAIMPVTPLNSTPNTMAKFTGTAAAVTSSLCTV